MKISNKKMVIHAETLGYNFLYYNRSLEELHAPNLKEIGVVFLFNNDKIHRSKYR